MPLGKIRYSKEISIVSLSSIVSSSEADSNCHLKELPADNILCFSFLNIRSSEVDNRGSQKLIKHNIVCFVFFFAFFNISNSRVDNLPFEGFNERLFSLLSSLSYLKFESGGFRRLKESLRDNIACCRVCNILSCKVDNCCRLISPVS